MSNFDTIFEEKIIQTIFVDHDFGKQIMEVMEPELFETDYIEKFGEILIDYYEKYDAFPSISLIPSLLEENNEDELVVAKCAKFIDRIQKRPLNGDIDYVKDKSLEFFRLQHLLSTFQAEVFPRIEGGSGRLEEIVPIIEKAINKGTDNDIGYDYMSDEEDRFIEENIKTIPTYWDAVNSKLRGGGFGEKRVITFLAPPGAGKSSLLVNVGASALEQGKVVVHYTLELDWREIAEKYDACLSGVEIDKLSGFKTQVLHSLKEKIPEGGRLIIKEYPMKGASIQTVKNHLAKLKLRDIVPDMVIIDQGGLLKSSSKDKENRHNLSANWIDMKGLAQVQRVPVITAHQINRSGYNEEVINLDQIAECFDIIGHSDAVITLARNIQQKQAGIGKVLFGKNRQGVDGVIMAYAINGRKAAIEIFDITPEIEEKMEQMKRDAEKEEGKSLAEKMKEYLRKNKKDG